MFRWALIARRQRIRNEILLIEPEDPSKRTDS